MFSLHWPFLLLLLPLPLMVRWLLPEHNQNSGAIRVPFFSTLKQLDGNSSNFRNSSAFTMVLIWLIWLCLLFAAARPIWIGEAISIPQDRRDLMLAVDISESMLEKDMLSGDNYIDRITAVKRVVGDFVQQRTGDRLGLVLFGQQAYLQTPLTHDRTTVNQQLQEARVGFAGRATAIGDTIGLAIKRLRGRPSESRVLVLLTDGSNTAGTDPKQAADIAAEADIRIHTIGVGATVKLTQDIWGRTRQRRVANQIDEVTLRYIAEKTGGQYFRAEDPESLKAIYAELDNLEPKPEEQTFREQRSLLHWPIGMALILSLLMLLGQQLPKRRGVV